jgi:hypothetical protein
MVQERLSVNWQSLKHRRGGALKPCPLSSILFEHLVGSGEELRMEFQPERDCCLQADRQTTTN